MSRARVGPCGRRLARLRIEANMEAVHGQYRVHAYPTSGEEDHDIRPLTCLFRILFLQLGWSFILFDAPDTL